MIDGKWHSTTGMNFELWNLSNNTCVIHGLPFSWLWNQRQETC